MFDEPASNLHPSAQMELLKSFESLPKVLYTTHSHYLINPRWLENTYVIKNEAIDYDDEISYNAKNTNIKISKYREFAVNHPNQTSYYQPILEILDYKPSNLDLVPHSIITEGKNDFYTLEFIKSNLNIANVNILPGTSASNLETLISLHIGWSKNFIILLDSDKEGIKQKARYIDLFGPILTERVFTYADVDILWQNYKMESLFSDTEKLRMQKIKFPDSEKYDKKTFNKSIQEVLVCKEKYIFENDSNRNIEKLFSFTIERLKKLENL